MSCQRRQLRILAQHRLGDLSGEFASFDQKRVGAVLVGVHQFGDGARELAKAARNDRDSRAPRLHCPDERARAGIERDAVAQDLCDHALWQSGEQRDPLAKRGLEGDLAAHRPFGDFRHLFANAGESRELVDAFLTDQRRVHVGDEEALQTPFGRLDDNVDRFVRERVFEGLADCRWRSLEEKIGRRAFVEPAPGLKTARALRRPCDQRIAERRFLRVGDQRGDGGGRRHKASKRGHAAPTVRRALLIAGPTASGKSGAALALAEEFGATIINADSMQVYADLKILTARPSAADERRAPHRLFGIVDGAVNYSAGQWSRAAREVLDESRDGPIIVVGGTGLYFRALTEGLSRIPSVPEAVRAEVRARAEGRATDDLHAELSAQDKESAARLRATDRQRILRALEVFAATGRPLVSFHGAREAPPLAQREWAGLFIAPERDELYRRIDARFDAMCAAGALDEVEALASRRLDPEAAGDARAGRCAADRPSQRRVVGRGCGGAGETRHAPLRQAPVHLGAPSARGFQMGRAE